tara:strand:- start:128 stop:562 length:435 start_codon:yes stop_codon:yes gene_type:complete
MNISGSWETTEFDCDEITNNGLYLIFVGYLLPLISPKVRDYGKELLSMFRNAGNVAGDIVSLTEFGFEKIQDLSDNKEMIKFIQKYCDNKKINILPSQISELSWDFSGDTGNGEKDGKQETWKRLLSKLNDYSKLNKMDNTNKP